MDAFRRNYDEDIHGQWRANAGEKVVYTEDFPAPILCATEFTDNSTGKGKAKKVEITFDISGSGSGTESGMCTFTHTDDGVGIERVSDLSRFLKFGSTQSSGTFHHYAWGRFRAMTAFMPDYKTAQWTIDFRLCNNPTVMSRLCQPWSTTQKMQDSMTEVPVTDSNRGIGFGIQLNFKMSIFGELAKTYSEDPAILFNKMKERLTTKYSEEVLQTTELILTVKKGSQVIRESSRENNWKTFEQMLRELSETSPASCQIMFDKTLEWKSIQFRATEYFLAKDNDELRQAFPTFGRRALECQRVHISNDGRLIESRAKTLMDKRKNLHGYQNGEIVFIDAFAGDTGSFLDQPTPATTKVSIKDDCVNLPGIYQEYLNEKKSIEDEKASERKAREKELKEQRKKRTVLAAVPAPAPAPAPAAAAAAAPAPVSVPISLVPLTLSSVASVAPVASVAAQVTGGGCAAAAAAPAPVQRKYTSMHLASCDGLYSDMPEVRVTVTQGTGAELAKKPSVPKSKPRQAFLPEEVVSIIRDASKYMTQDSFAAFKADMNSKYSLGME
jgi:hypothetical protein